MQKMLMDLLDSRINIELIIKQDKKVMDILRVASVPVKGKDPVFATSVVWISSWIDPQFEDQEFHEGELVLINWRMGHLICSRMIGRRWVWKGIKPNTNIVQ